MKGSPQRQHLEEALTGERAGSPTIRALSDYAMLKDVEWLEAKRPVREHSREERERIVQKAVVEHDIDMWRVSRDVLEYFEAFDNAEEILAPYVATGNPDVNPYQLFLDDLREINRGALGDSYTHREPLYNRGNHHDQ